MHDPQSKAVTIALAYGPAALMAIAASIPGVNILYSGHGGPAWLLLPLAFPFAALVLWSAYRQSAPKDRPAAKRFILFSVAFYLPLSLAASYVGVASIRSSFGLIVSPWQMWALFLSPFGLPFVWY